MVKVYGSVAVLLLAVGFQCAESIFFSVGWGKDQGSGWGWSGSGYGGGGGWGWPSSGGSGWGWPSSGGEGWGWEEPQKGWGWEQPQQGWGWEAPKGGWGWEPPKVHETHEHVYKVIKHKPNHVYKVKELDHHQHKVFNYDHHKKVVIRPNKHIHHLHLHELHKNLLLKHKLHQHNLHKHNLHVVKVVEPVIHKYHKDKHQVIHKEQAVHQVIPIHQEEKRVHHHHQENPPTVINHGWGWGEQPAHGGGYAGGHGGWNRRSDVGVAEESAPAATVLKPAEEKSA